MLGRGLLCVSVAVTLLALTNCQETKQTYTSAQKAKAVSDIVCGALLKVLKTSLDTVQDAVCSAFNFDAYVKEVCQVSVCAIGKRKRDLGMTELDIHRQRRLSIPSPSKVVGGIVDTGSKAGGAIVDAGNKVGGAIVDTGNTVIAWTSNTMKDLCKTAGCNQPSSNNKYTCDRVLQVDGLKTICKCVGTVLDGITLVNRTGTVNLLAIQSDIVNMLINGIKCALSIQNFLTITTNLESKSTELSQSFAGMGLISQLPLFNYEFYARFGIDLGVCLGTATTACQAVTNDAINWLGIAVSSITGVFSVYAVNTVNKMRTTTSTYDVTLNELQNLTVTMQNMLKPCKLDSKASDLQKVNTGIQLAKDAVSSTSLGKIESAIKSVARLVDAVPTSPYDFFDPKTWKDLSNIPRMVQSVVSGAKATKTIDDSVAASRKSVTDLNTLLSSTLMPLTTQFQSCKTNNANEKSQLTQISAGAATITKATDQGKQVLSMFSKVTTMRIDGGVKSFDYFLNINLPYPYIDTDSENKYIGYFEMRQYTDSFDMIVPGFIPYLKFYYPF